jgi:hypothetical protein
LTKPKKKKREEEEEEARNMFPQIFFSSIVVGCSFVLEVV